ncbi:phage tail tape measure protein [Thomasclavelia cocleata]|uniref:phage tail tape measure protein n=1 Tax=Thomasclavelia cocleata TaxID=69824 RepID=UPI002494D942|nr:phage tail tape measure protein [Thomasclavelia cocleata]
MGSGIELAPLVTKLKVDINSFKTDMDKVKTEAVRKADEVSKQLEKIAKVGAGMSKVGSALTKGVTVPLAAAGVAATKMAIDYESSFAKVSTLLDKNVVDYDKYKNDILDASSESKVAVDEFSEAVYGSISAGVDQTKAIKFTTDAMKLAKGGFTDGAKAVDVMTTAINGYSMTADDAAKISDMLITTQNLGKTTVDELASSMGAVIPVAASVNFGMEELSASYAQLTKNGIATAESGTYLKSMLSELGKSGSVTDKALRELTGKGFADLKKEGKSTSEILILLDEEAKKNGKTLKDMFGSVEAGSAALVLAKGNGEEYNEMLAAMQTSAGATQEAFDKMDATPAEKLKGAVNELKNSAIKLGTNMIPVVTTIADKINELVQWFNKLTPEQQKNIVKWGALAAAAGPVLKITGGLVTSYTKLRKSLIYTNTLISKGIPLLGKLGTNLASSSGPVGKLGSLLSKLGGSGTAATTALTTVAGSTGSLGTAAASAAGTAGIGGLLSSLGGMAVAAAPWVAGGAAVVGACYGIYKAVTADVIPAVDLYKVSTTAAFNEVTGKYEIHTVKISEETQKQVQAYLDLSNSAQQETMNMYAGITAATDENVSSITTKVNDMAASIIAATNNQRNEVVGKYNDMFANTTAITDQEKAEILNSVQEGFDQRITNTEEMKNEILAIYEQIKQQGGHITSDQQARLDELYNNMKTNAVQAMAQNEAEQNVILNRLASSTERVTAEMVGNTIKEMNKEYKEQVKTAGKKRDELVRQAEELKTLEGGKYAEKAQRIIDAANKEYEETVESSKKIKKEGIDKLMSAHSEFADSVDITTGEIVNWWDKMFGKWDKWQPESKTATITTKHLDVYGEVEYGSDGKKHRYLAYNGLDYVPYDGYNTRLHEGERVLTKKENIEYSKGMQSGKKITIKIPFNIDGREFAIAEKDYLAEELGF